jgi:hypothetical protein
VADYTCTWQTTWYTIECSDFQPDRLVTPGWTLQAVKRLRDRIGYRILVALCQQSCGRSLALASEATPSTERKVSIVELAIPATQIHTSRASTFVYNAPPVSVSAERKILCEENAPKRFVTISTGCPLCEFRPSFSDKDVPMQNRGTCGGSFSIPSPATRSFSGFWSGSTRNWI